MHSGGRTAGESVFLDYVENHLLQDWNSLGIAGDAFDAVGEQKENERKAFYVEKMKQRTLSTIARRAA